MSVHRVVKEFVGLCNPMMPVVVPKRGLTADIGGPSTLGNVRSVAYVTTDRLTHSQRV